MSKRSQVELKSLSVFLTSGPTKRVFVFETDSHDDYNEGVIPSIPSPPLSHTVWVKPDPNPLLPERAALIAASVTDIGLVHLKGLPQLQGLVLQKTTLSDTGLENIRGLTNLRQLVVNNAQVTDAGLEHLKGMANLWRLDLSST